MKNLLENRKVLITAGPTREAIDPVRYISNHSTGKMGYAIAKEFLSYGCEVVLVSGPVMIELAHPNLELIKVESASDMYQACNKKFEWADIAVFSAAVADYRPLTAASQKIKKCEEEFSIVMTRNVDIAYEFGRSKHDHQLSVGFALETCNEISHARAKLLKKNFDMVVLNSMRDENAGFGFDTNRVTLLIKNGLPRKYPLKSKAMVAKDIVREINTIIDRKEKQEVQQYEMLLQ